MTELLPRNPAWLFTILSLTDMQLLETSTSGSELGGDAQHSTSGVQNRCSTHSWGRGNGTSGSRTNEFECTLIRQQLVNTEQ